MICIDISNPNPKLPPEPLHVTISLRSPGFHLHKSPSAPATSPRPALQSGNRHKFPPRSSKRASPTLPTAVHQSGHPQNAVRSLQLVAPPTRTQQSRPRNFLLRHAPCPPRAGDGVRNFLPRWETCAYPCIPATWPRQLPGYVYFCGTVRLIAGIEA